MEYTVLGRTTLNVSVLGLGCGGPSRIGRTTGRPLQQSIALIKQALDAGVNYFDTAEVYDTEEILGTALKGVPRHDVVISTKKGYKDGISPSQVREGLELSLGRLGMDYVDIYSLHGVLYEDYPAIRDIILPTLVDLRDEGKLRFIGITENFTHDRRHSMLRDALSDDHWDAIMVGFNILNQTARHEVLPQAIEHDVGVQVMYAVRYALSRRDQLKETLRILVREGQVQPSDIDPKDPLGFVLKESDAATLVEAAYRFCRHESGVDLVLSGTGDEVHLRDNISAVCRPPLPESLVARLHKMFAHANLVTG